MKRTAILILSVILILSCFILFALPELQAYWIWTPQTNRWVNPKQEPKGSPQEQFEWAMSFYQSEDYKSAFKEFRKMVKYYPRSKLAPQAQFNMGVCQEKLGDFYKAFLEYQMVIDKYPGNQIINDVLEKQFKIGELFLEGKKKKVMGVNLDISLVGDKAVEIFKKIIENAPYGEYADNAQFKLGLAYEKSNRYDEAATEFKKLLKEYPESDLTDETKYHIGLCSYRFSLPSDYDDKATLEARQNFEKFVREHPQSPKAQEAQQALGQLTEKEAKKTFDIAKFYERQKALESALIYYQKIIDKYPQTKWAEESKKRIEQINKQGRKE